MPASVWSAVRVVLSTLPNSWTSLYEAASYLLIFRCAVYNGRSCLPPQGLPIRFDVEHTGRYNRAYLGDTFRARFALALDWKTERCP